MNSHFRVAIFFEGLLLHPFPCYSTVVFTHIRSVQGKRGTAEQGARREFATVNCKL
jgi:hypothetical protein